MNTYDQIFKALERIETQLVEIRKFDRVTTLQVLQCWLKSGWTVVVATYIYLLQRAWGKP
jgi:hypothetical protein